MTQYLLSVHAYAADGTTKDMSPEEMEKAFKAVDVFNQELQASGGWVFGGGLHPPTSATTVRPTDGDVLITDGPYAETKEYLGGFWVIDVADLDAALDWAKKGAVACANPVEVRPFQDEPEA